MNNTTNTEGERMNEIRYRLSSDCDVAEYATLDAAMAARRDGEIITVVAYHNGAACPFWTAIEA